MRYESKTRQQFCVFNKTRESFLSLSVSGAESGSERWRALIGRLRLKSDEGIWVTPSQGVHTFGFSLPSDLIYLDTNRQVVELFESFGSLRISRLRRSCSSVLELPTHTIHYSQTRVGDELLICPPDEMQEYLNREGEFIGDVSKPLAVLARGARWSTAASQTLLGSEGKQDLKTRAYRYPGLHILATYWDGGSPREHTLRDISATGAYVEGAELWYPGTVLTITLRRRAAPRSPGSAPIEDKLQLLCQVVRQDTDGGLGLRFAFREKSEQKALERFVHDSLGLRVSVPARGLAARLRRLLPN